MTAPSNIPESLSAAHNASAAAGERVFTIRGSMPGIIFGTPVVLDDQVREPPADILPESERAAELARYKAGHQKAIEKYAAAMEKAASLQLEIRKETTKMVRAEFMMVSNEAEYKKYIPEMIEREGATAQRAVFIVLNKRIEDMAALAQKSKAEMEAATDPAVIDMKKGEIEMYELFSHYIGHVQHAVMREVDPDFRAASVNDLEEKAIPLIPYISVQTILDFADSDGRARIKGAVSIRGSDTDHPNVIGRGIGALLTRMDKNEYEALCRDVKSGDIKEIIIDAKKGRLIANPTPDTRMKYVIAVKQQNEINAELLSRSQKEDGWTYSHDPDKTRRVKIKVGANIGQSSDMRAVSEAHAKGVGLCRTEMAVLLRKQGYPTEDKWFEIFKDIVERGRDPKTGKTKKITFRVVDFAGDKFDERMSDLTPEGRKAQEQEIIRNQMAAVLRVAKYVEEDQKTRGQTLKQRVFLMIPNITSPEELQHYQDMIDAEAARLEESGQCEYPYIQLGAMVENPAIVRKLRHVKAAFFSIGTNDLIPYTLGYDRFGDDADEKYDPSDPAVLDEITTTLQYERPDCPVSVCGDMASNPRYFALLIGAGIRNFSVGASQVPLIKELARRINVQEAQALFHEVRAEASRPRREKLLDEFNEKYLGLNPDMSLDMNWQPGTKPGADLEVKPTQHAQQANEPG